MTDANHNQREQMRRAIAGLPEPTRTIYRLHLIEDLGFGAIADRLGTVPCEIERHVALAIVLIDAEMGAID